MSLFSSPDRHPPPELQRDMIFTYVDADYFVPSPERRGGSSAATMTTTRSFSSYLSAGVTALPRHNLCGGTNGGHGHLSSASASVHDRLSREDPFRVMYIMAAVDCDVER